MCGLIGVFHTGENKTPVNDIVLNQFEDQKERGQNGFGIIKIKDDMKVQIDRSTEGYKFMWDIHQDPVRAMIMHHRIPTSSENKISQTHPMKVDNGSLKFKYLLVHNGVITNDDKLKEEHEKLGFIYNTFKKDEYNDSECLAIEVARFIEKQTEQIGTIGNVAFICIQISRKTEKVTRLFYGRNEGNPLNMAKTRNKLMLSSTGPGTEVKTFKLYECKLDSEMKLTSRQMLFAAPPPFVSDWYQDKFGSWKQKSKTSIGTGVGTDIVTNEDWDSINSDYGHYQSGYIPKNKKDAANDTPTVYDDEEGNEVEVAVSDATEFIQLDLDGFFDLLYDAKTAENMTAEDVDLTIESIKRELITLLDNVKQGHLNIALNTEAPKQIAIGFH